jgi:hypothetical protein
MIRTNVSTLRLLAHRPSVLDLSRLSNLARQGHWDILLKDSQRTIVSGKSVNGMRDPVQRSQRALSRVGQGCW